MEKGRANVMAKVAVVGCGGFGKHHARVLSDLGALAAVCDIVEEKAKFYGEKYRVEHFTSVESLGKLGLDAAVVATPTVTHAPVAVKLIEQGVKYILLEKPFTITLSEARELAGMARKDGVELMVGFVERFNQAVVATKDLVEGNEIGAPILHFTSRFGRWPEQVFDVGVVKDTAIHDIDILGYISNERPSQVYATTGRLVHHKHEDFANIVLTYASGKAAVIEANWLTPRKTRKLNVTGTEGVIEADLMQQSITVMKQGETRMPNMAYKEPLMLELQHFVECVESGSSPKPNEEDAMSALEIAEIALRSSSTGMPVKL
ncbi:MAG: Gfo/Idh/MocA family oxidoreductase [Candidatus Brockarchaeota archaeon]|nr:Gfo/Idh/MocA family oxidoreductase [Candidatus Brockarchaeota archaeon]